MQKRKKNAADCAKALEKSLLFRYNIYYIFLKKGGVRYVSEIIGAARLQILPGQDKADL
jgi:hypothetical protein